MGDLGMSDSKRLLGFDFGMSYIGVAAGQTLTKTATPITALKARDGQPNWDEVKALIDEWSPNQLIVGLPLNMDDTDQLITKAAKKFAKRLEGRYGLPVSLWDERLSSIEAKQQLFQSKGKQAISDPIKLNSTAAAVILEDYLQHQSL